jgi:acyl dehydratase
MAGRISFEDIQVGHEFEKVTKEPVTEVQLVKYAGASGDFNPIHTVHHVAEQAGLGGVIAHGMLIMGFVGQAITTWVPHDCLRKFSVRFRGMTRPGDVITVTGNVTGKKGDGPARSITCEVTAADQKGEVKIVGSFEAVLPSGKEE